MKANPQDYKTAETKLRDIFNTEKTVIKNFDTEINELERKFDEFLRTFREAKDKKKREVEEKRDELKKQFDDSKIEPRKIINDFNRIIELIKVIKSEKKEKKSLKISACCYNRRNYSNESIALSPLDTLVCDQYKNIEIFIAPNRKPKNKYSLVFAGFSIFEERDSKILTLAKSYGVDIHSEDKYFDIAGTIKDSETEKDLINYYNKNKSKILKEFLEEHSEVEKEYEEVKKETENSKEWELAYLEHMKKYYEEDYSQGTETEEYKEIIRQIKSLEECVNNLLTSVSKTFDKCNIMI